MRRKGLKARRTGRILVAVGLFLVGVAVVAALPAAAKTEHCPSGGTKNASGSAGNVVILEAGTNFCVKASNEATGILVADGTKTLIQYVGAAGITNDRGIAHDVSYYVIYPTPPPTPTPTVSPSETPAVTPTPETSPTVLGEVIRRLPATGGATDMLLLGIFVIGLGFLASGLGLIAAAKK